ncbi:DUF736 family protein [Sulfurovum sp. XTW-4]|uniref:DUF736 family protein n=1 Tax=Sulfurovum xiamenensis TaxID=3019066 RepID=A0ABT7QUE7_9BACT|nr:DUF736 family protein [Sulfurovum xiamenensis]MDM5264696.1 DUF736 family protein [Sulfurovum xiamenensis]
MTIGFVRQKEEEINNQMVKWLELSVRIPIGSFSATMSKVKDKKESNSPDYNVYWSPNRKGESFDRVKIGSLWMKKSEKGNEYMSGYLESPLFQNGKIYIAIVKYTPSEGMPVQPILYNILWSNDNFTKSNQSQSNEPESSYAGPTTHNGIPVEYEGTGINSEDDIPF